MIARRHQALSSSSSSPSHIHLSSPSRCHAHTIPRHHASPHRTFTSSSVRHQNPHRKESFRTRLGSALRGTKIEWYWLPATAGIAFVGGLQSYRVYSTARDKREEEEEASLYSEEGEEDGKRPKKRKRIKPSGPWCVHSLIHSLSFLVLSDQDTEAGEYSAYNLILTNRGQQAGPDHVHPPPQSPLPRLGLVQLLRHPILLPRARLQTLLLHLRRQVSSPHINQITDT